MLDRKGMPKLDYSSLIPIDKIRDKVAQQGGSSVFDGVRLLTIVDGLERSYPVLMVFGSYYIREEKE